MVEKSIAVEFSPSDSVTVATIIHSTLLDATNGTQFGDRVLAYLKNHSGIQLLLNFEQVNYMSSAGLTELLRINEALQAWGASVHLCGLNCDIHNVFCITNLDKLFAIHTTDSVDEAIAQCCGASPGSEH